MSDMLGNAVAWLDGARRIHLSRPVLYARGDDSVEVQAGIGQTTFRLDDGTGAMIRTVQRDFLISAADLILADETVLPQRYDRITESVGSTVYTHEVIGPGGGEPDWRWADPYRTTLRVHTKQVDES